MLVTELGIFALVMPECANAQRLILMTEYGMGALLRFLQPLNALSPMLVTEYGMVTLVIFLSKPEMKSPSAFFVSVIIPVTR